VQPLIDFSAPVDVPGSLFLCLASAQSVVATGRASAAGGWNVTDLYQKFSERSTD